MNIVCAYCHSKGHHINYCGELLAKKNRKMITEKSSDVKRVRQTISITNVKDNKRVLPMNNMFANLYSSEDEDEYNNDAATEQALKKECSDVNVDKWINGPKVDFILGEDEHERADVSVGDCDYTKLCAGYIALSYYGIKYKGMSWADIENLSEEEE